MFANEKPGGHGERSVAIGTVDMAIWDAVAKIAGVPLYRLLADRYNGGTVDEQVFVYAAGGYYYPGKDLTALQDEMRRYLDLGYSVVKMKIGGAPLAEDLARIEAVLEVVGRGDRLAVDANGRFDLRTAIAYARALEPYGLFWYEEAGDPLDYALQAELAGHYAGPMATGENLFSMQDARNLIRHGGMRPDRDWLQFDCALSYGLVEYLRTLAMLRRSRLVAAPLHPARRAPDVAQHRGRPRPRRQRVVPRCLPALRRLCRRHAGRRRLRHAAADRRASASRPSRACTQLRRARVAADEDVAWQRPWTSMPDSRRARAPRPVLDHRDGRARARPLRRHLPAVGGGRAARGLGPDGSRGTLRLRAIARALTRR